ncbi:hypothetical protein B0H17DRAFT_1144495 [Mycena rosella]|uniref:Uncharacterized protein n=1 Tax=Mycena rosella TaxID=1033263 RepID=A0AAD7G5M4_MYCRO|nr:hypothetical protein B0H17DRAFT_1144495 [Mycena rosella]
MPRQQDEDENKAQAGDDGEQRKSLDEILDKSEPYSVQKKRKGRFWCAFPTRQNARQNQFHFWIHYRKVLREICPKDTKLSREIKLVDTWGAKIVSTKYESTTLAESTEEASGAWRRLIADADDGALRAGLAGAHPANKENWVELVSRLLLIGTRTLMNCRI